MAAYLRSRKVRRGTTSPVDVIREAMRYGVIGNGDLWADAVDRRNMMSHTYDPRAFRLLVEDAAGRFLGAFRSLEDALTGMPDH